MAEEVPPQIRAPDDIQGDSPVDPAAARKTYEASRTVQAVDPRTNTVIDLSPEDAKTLAGYGYKVGDDAPLEALKHQPLEKLSVFSHAAANTGSFGLYDTAVRAGGGSKYLEYEAKLRQANPKTAIAGDLAGGAVSAPLREFSLASKLKTGSAIALTAMEGGLNAANEAAAMKQPLTAEQVIQGMTYGAGSNALFNVAIGGAAHILGKGAQGARALNDKYKIFEREAVKETVPRSKVKFSVEGDTPPVTPPGVSPDAPPDVPGAPVTPPSEPIITPVNAAPKDLPPPPMGTPTADNPHPLNPDGTVHPTALTVNEAGRVEFGQHVTKTEAVNNIDEQMRRMMGRQRFSEYNDSANQAWKGRTTPHKKLVKALDKEFPAREIDGVKYPSFDQLRTERKVVQRMSHDQFVTRLRVRERPIVPDTIDAETPGNDDITPANPTADADAISDAAPAPSGPRRPANEDTEVSNEDRELPRSIPAASNDNVENPSASTLAPPMPYENPAEGQMYPALDGLVQTIKHDPAKLQENFLKAENLWHETLIKLDKAKAGSPEAKQLKAESDQYHHVVNAVQEEMAVHDPTIKPPPTPQAGKEIKWGYDSDLTLEQKKSFVGDMYNHVLGDEGQAMQAVYLKLNEKLHFIKDLNERAKLKDMIKGQERELHLHFPRTVNPETGEVLPGWRDLQKEYARIHGNVHVDPDSLPFKLANAEEKSAIEAGEQAHKDHPEMDLGEDKDAKPENKHIPKETDTTGEDRTLPPEITEPTNTVSPDPVTELNQPPEAVSDAATEAETAADPEAATEDTPEAPPPADEGESAGAPEAVPEAPGETGEAPPTEPPATPGETPPTPPVPPDPVTPASAPNVTPPKLGDYKPRIERWKLMHLGLFSGPFKPLVHTVAALNELGPLILNNADRFTKAMLKVSDAANGRIGSAIRHAISAHGSRVMATAPFDVDAQYRKTIALVALAEANPLSLAQNTRQALGPGADKHPEATAGVVAGLSAAASVINRYRGRSPNEPTPRDDDFDPPRHEKVRVNQITRGVFDPASVIEDPDPDTWAAVKQVHPETVAQVQEALLHIVMNPKIKLTRQTARNLSILLEMPITPANNADYIKGKHEAAIVMAVPNPPGKPGSSGGGAPTQGNAKISEQLVAMTNPDPNAQLGS